MKTLYKLSMLAALALLCGMMQAQILNYDFENLNAGDNVAETLGDPWTTWDLNPGSETDARVIADSINGNHSMKIGFTSDIVLQLGNKTSGAYKISLDMLIPDNKAGYFNILHDFDGWNSVWALQVHLNQNNNSYMYTGSHYYGFDNVPYNAWNHIEVEIYLDDALACLKINGQVILMWDYTEYTFAKYNCIAAMDFCDVTGEEQYAGYYVDNIKFEEIEGPYSYDFSAVCETGQILYYNVIDASNNSVCVTYPEEDDFYLYYDDPWGNYIKPTGDLIIPTNVVFGGKTYRVISINSSAFRGCSGLTSVTIPNSVTSIVASAFWDCSGLTSLTIPNSVTSIGDCAFYNCSELTSLTIPNSVTSIGSCAFYNCSGLTGNLMIPNSVISIGAGAFFYCNKLTSIIVASGNTVYDSRENCNAIIETSTNIMILGCKNSFIPNSVTSIGDCAFVGCYSLTSLTIPNSVTSIGAGAFWGCSELTSLTIPNSVTSIGDCAFDYCIGLTSMIVLAETPPSLIENAFYEVPKTIPVYVPHTSLNAYQTAYGWNEFTNYQGIYVGVDENDFTTMQVYPNPTKKNVIIECDDIISVTIMNSSGATIQNIDGINQGNYIVELDRFPVGVYYLQIKTKDGVTIRKVIKQ